MGIHEAEPDEYLAQKFSYPVYVHLKGADLYADKLTGKYSRTDFHKHPENYNCLFSKYIARDRYFNEWCLLGRKNSPAI